MTTKAQRRSGRGQPTERVRAAKRKTVKRRETSRAIDRQLLSPEKKLRDRDIPAAKAIFLQVWERTGFVSEACRLAGIGRRTFYDWIHEDPNFKKEAIQARKIWRATMIPDLEASMAVRGHYKDTLSGIFLLKHNTKRYREVSRVELSGPDGGPVVTVEAKEELIKRLERLADRASRKEQIIGRVAVGELPAGSSGSRGSQGPQLGIIRAGSAGSGVRKVKRDS